ncbi:hypothetical protein JAAARDRAFT_206695 [Jaapia argillacea MUCL 33604]|uniref:Uncharacterized protein n=1 Tax=Jaapia argillacea MUCL 33604 TaxID=933084 RepID=A0A067PT32_9AGAM|nr:hypothetical protein JAAARDRAFT_206695 [Jaapia argillacea MUCL 33604]
MTLTGYHRTVVLLWPTQADLDIRIAAGGIPSALHALKISTSTSPLPSERKIVDYLLGLSWHLDQKYAVKLIIQLALRRKDSDIWSKAFLSSSSSDPVDLKQLIIARDTFPFPEIRPTVDSLLVIVSQLCGKLEIINLFNARRSNQPDDAIVEWRDQQISITLLSVKSLTEEDAPLKNIVQTLLVQKGRSPVRAPGNLAHCPGLDASIEANLGAAISHWQSPPSIINPSLHPYRGQSTPTASAILKDTLARVVYLVDLSAKQGHAHLCENLFQRIIEVEQDWRTKLVDFIKPLIVELRRIAHKYNLDIRAAPFANFLASSISLYLRHVLCAEPPQVRKIGCGCADCGALDVFLASTEIEKVFAMNQHRRTHLETRLRSAGDLVHYAICRIRSPQSQLVVTKLDVLATTQSSAARASAAQSFLAAIGDVAVLSAFVQ